MGLAGWAKRLNAITMVQLIRPRGSRPGASIGSIDGTHERGKKQPIDWNIDGAMTMGISMREGHAKLDEDGAGSSGGGVHDASAARAWVRACVWTARVEAEQRGREVGMGERERIGLVGQTDWVRERKKDEPEIEKNALRPNEKGAGLEPNKLEGELILIYRI